MSLLTAGCETDNRFAARLTVPLSITARKASIWRRFIALILSGSL